MQPQTQRLRFVMPFLIYIFFPFVDLITLLSPLLWPFVN